MARLFISSKFMRAYFVSAWLSGLRGRSFHTVFLLGLLLIGGAYLAALLSPRQPETVALDVGLSGLRFALVLLGLFWVQEMVGKEIERRTTTLYLAYPIPRSRYILGRFAGIAALLLTACIILSLLLWLAVMSSGEGFEQSRRVALGLPYFAAVFGIWLDVLVVTAFALCIAALSTVSALPLATGAAFAIAGHSLGAVIQYLASGANGRQDLVGNYTPIMDMASWILPDLARLDWRTWPMYDLPPAPETPVLACLMAISYISLLLIVATQAFKQRDFD